MPDQSGGSLIGGGGQDEAIKTSELISPAKVGTDPTWKQMCLQVIVVLANLEVADRLRVAFLLSIPMCALLGCVGGSFLGFLSQSRGASA